MNAAELLSSAASERREPANPGFPARPIRRARGFVRSSVAMDVALWLRIFGRLDADDLVRASAVCREWRDVCDDDFLWTELTRRDAPATLVARDEMGEDSRRAYFCNEAWRCGAFIRRPDPVLSAPCVAMAFHESSANLVSVTADGVLSTTPLDADDGAPSSPPDPPLGDARSSPTAPITAAAFLDSSRPDDAAVCGDDRGRIRIIRSRERPSRLVARYDGRVTALACLARRDADDQAILAMSTRKTIGGAPGFGGAGNKGMLALLRVDERDDGDAFGDDDADERLEDDTLRRNATRRPRLPSPHDASPPLRGWRVTSDVVTTLVAAPDAAAGSFFAGDSGGAVVAYDAGEGYPRAVRTFVGQCACPVHRVTACGAVRGAVLASYRHETGLRGTGHARGCLVFDARTGNREATLAAGAGTGGGWGGSPCALHADDRKVVCVGGDVAAVFDTRTWTATSEIRMGWGESTRVAAAAARGARFAAAGEGGETRAFEADVGRRLSVVESPWG